MTDQVSDALRATCMKARVYSTAFGTSITVKDASRKVERDHHAIAGAARVLANKLAGADAHDKAVRSAQRFCADTLGAVSMPYGSEDGWRLLPTVNFMPPAPLLERLSEGKRMFDQALAEYAHAADDILAVARQNLGDLDVPLPTKEELISAYTLRWAFEELPSGKIHGLPESTQSRIARAVDKQLSLAAETARKHTLERFVRPLEHFVTAMGKYDEYEAANAVRKKGDPVATGFFRDTVVTNIKGLYDTLSSFNVLGDEDVVELGNMVASLANTNPDALRNHPEVRKAASARANEILGNLNEWLSPPRQAQAAE